MKLDEGCTIVSKKDAENLGQKIQIWELACRKNIRVEGIAQGEEVEWEENIWDGELRVSLFLLSEFTVLASWLFWLCESWSLCLMINVCTRTIDQTNELLQNSCNILLKALIKSAGLTMRAELVETSLHNAICKIQLKKRIDAGDHKNDIYWTPKFDFNQIFM